MIDFVRSRQRSWAFDMAISVREAFALRDTPTDDDFQRVINGLRITAIEIEAALSHERENTSSEELQKIIHRLPRPHQRWAIARAIGNHLWCKGWQAWIGQELALEEQQADLFAGFLLLGAPWLAQVRTVEEIVERADVPREHVVQWLKWMAS